MGDYEYKANSERGPCEQLVSPEPEVTALDKSDNDEFAVLACDGVWDVMTNEEVCIGYDQARNERIIYTISVLIAFHLRTVFIGLSVIDVTSLHTVLDSFSK